MHRILAILALTITVGRCPANDDPKSAAPDKIVVQVESNESWLKIVLPILGGSISALLGLCVPALIACLLCTIVRGVSIARAMGQVHGRDLAVDSGMAASSG